MTLSKIRSLYFRSDYKWLQIHASSICTNAVHDLALIKLIVSRLVGTGRFLIRYYNGRTKINTSPVKEVPQLFLTKNYSFNLKNK
jgi:hypothetical protein